MAGPGSTGANNLPVLSKWKGFSLFLWFGLDIFINFGSWVSLLFLLGFFASFSVTFLWFFFFTGFSVFGNCFLFVYVVLCS